MSSLFQKLPDDLVRKICAYANHRIDKYGNFIKRIDFEKYKFLEKIISRKMVNVSKVKTYDENSGRELPNIILEIKYTLANFCELPDRKDQLIDDDMMYVYLNIKDDAVSYIIQKFRLKKIEDFLTKHKPSSIYHRGNYQDYDWEVSTLSDLYFV
jgi:hypothetical protein